MNSLTRAAIPFLGITIVGLSVFVWQTRHLASLQQVVTHLPQPEVQGKNPGHPAETDISPKAPKPKSTLLTRVSEKLLSSGEIVRLTSDHSVASQLASATVAANLSPAEKATFKDAFTKFENERTEAYMDASLTDEERTKKLAEISRSRDEWVASQLGVERAVSFKARQGEFARAKAERNATSAVSKLSAVVNLSTAQKDELFAAFVERGQEPPALPTHALNIVPLFKIDMDPARPELGEAEEALDILDADQWAAYREVYESNMRAFVTQQNAMTEKIFPAIATTLGEVAKEEKSRAKQNK